MRKVLAKKTQPRKKTPSPRKRVSQREIEPTAHVIERKKKRQPAKSTTAGKTTRAKKKTSKTSKTRSSESSRKAKSVGRAVGKVLGRAIGTVERALTKVRSTTDALKK
ncbi:MAG: hypothetical protein KIT40_08915 [Nitrospira sp.]|nr:hypothetical protein [Nitrospira sp.]